MSGSLLSLLRILSSRDIEYVVVGGMAGVLHGAPVVTTDLDIVHRRSDKNVTALLTVLSELHAVFRADPRKLSPTASQLMGTGHLLLVTDQGPLDVLCEVQSQGYDELMGATESVRLGNELTAQIVTLEKLIELKEGAGRPKDQQALPILRATLAELKRR